MLLLTNRDQVMKFINTPKRKKKCVMQLNEQLKNLMRVMRENKNYYVIHQLVGDVKLLVIFGNHNSKIATV